METDRTKKDIAIDISKSIVSECPYVGSLVSEVIGSLIPNQRIDRISEFIKKLDSRVGKLEQQHVSDRFQEPEFVDLLENGFLQASRALSEERLDYLANLFEKTLTEEELNHIENKRILVLLGELNDVEIIMLQSYSTHPDEEPEFFERHKHILTPPAADKASPVTEFDKEAIFQSHRRHLIRLELIEPNFKKPRKGQLPDFDLKTGMIKASGYKITYLGQMLLNRITESV